MLVGRRNKLPQIPIASVLGIDMIIVFDPIRILRIVQSGFALPFAPMALVHIIIGNDRRTKINDIHP